MEIAAAVAATTTLVDGEPRPPELHLGQQIELTRALTALRDDGDAMAKDGRVIRCYYNCSPPVGSVTVSPQVVSVVAGTVGAVTIHWRWDQSSTQAVTQHSCL